MVWWLLIAVHPTGMGQRWVCFQFKHFQNTFYGQPRARVNLVSIINHIYQRMRIRGLPTVHTFYKTPKCFGSKTPSSRSLKYKGVQASRYYFYRPLARGALWQPMQFKHDSDDDEDDDDNDCHVCFLSGWVPLQLFLFLWRPKLGTDVNPSVLAVNISSLLLQKVLPSAQNFIILIHMRLYDLNACIYTADVKFILIDKE